MKTFFGLGSADHKNKLYKILAALCLLVFSFKASFGMHLKGGHIEYRYIGVGNNAGTSKYLVTTTIFYGCGLGGPRNPISLTISDAVTNATVQTVSLTSSANALITKQYVNPCMTNPPTICYDVYTYITTLELPDSPDGYILSTVNRFRTAGIVNISGSSSCGMAITANIPGTISGVDYHTNSSPVFAFKDTAIVCYNGPFTYQFEAIDAIDNDSISYKFGDGLNYTSVSTPPFATLPYVAPYSGANPMGSTVTINPVSGLISGTASSTTGEYVLAVYAYEWRGGILVDSIKKELQIYVYNCSLVAAQLNPSYINCKDYSFTFTNQSNASNVAAYHWDFGVPNITTDTSNQPTPTFIYPDTGTFTLKLKVTTTGGCSDSTSAIVKVYPGFHPNFSFTGSCFATPFFFHDLTTATYGTVNAWSWDFGDLSTISDTSTQKNPSYLYGVSGVRTVLLTVSSSKGCSDTVSKTVIANDKPFINLPFRDTLICSNDTLPLIAQSTGTYSWSPNYHISNTAISSPKVWPQDTTTYTVTVTDAGCVNSDSIKVNVLQFITVNAGNDTSLCKTDSILLRPISYALSYLWTPNIGLNNNLIKYPLASPNATITYHVTANLGHCQDKDSVTIHVSPYPKANAGIDTTICYGQSASLHGSIIGAYFTWSPMPNANANTLFPTVSPLATTTFALTVRDTFYCPKPFTDSVLVTVVPKVQVSAGNDTSIVLGQPLQLNASGGSSYAWAPPTWLSNANIQNPIASINNRIDSIRYFVTAFTPTGCNATASLLVKVFTTGPDIFVPSAFSPNGDGKNDILKPILVGISSFNYFKIYNRFGQLVFSTTQPEKGWDGKINGELQTTAAYVFMAQGVDYLGNTILRKGTSILVR